MWANKAELDMLGYAKEEFVGKSLYQFCSDEAELDRLLYMMAEKLPDSNSSLRLVCKNGSIVCKMTMISRNIPFSHV